jgi:hypothetical protein
MFVEIYRIVDYLVHLLIETVTNFGPYRNKNHHRVKSVMPVLVLTIFQ